jgi:hypothetical protein
MTDCPNAEMRDRLPDLLHERLDMSVRAVVMAHVDQCADCRGELVLLREAHSAFVSSYRPVDVAAITRVVIERTRTPARLPSRSRWMDWRVAASIALLLVGAGSLRHFVRPREEATRSVAIVDTPHVAPNVTASVPVAAESVHPAVPVPVVTAASAELSAAAPVSDLSETDLRALLNELDQMDAVPPTEPEPEPVRVSLPGSGSSE